MDFEFILNVAERRIKAALGKADAGKIVFTLVTDVLIKAAPHDYFLYRWIRLFHI